MAINCFLYGLTAFIMAMVVLLLGSRASHLELGRHFIWLSAFGLLLSIYAWGRMFDAQINAGTPTSVGTLLLFAFPASGVMLIRFGSGLMTDAGNLPPWLPLIPLVIFVLLGLVVAYGMVSIMTTPLNMSLIRWSRILLIFPGSLLAAFGCIQQWRRLNENTTVPMPRLALPAAAGAFLFYGVIAGLVTHDESMPAVLLAGLPIEIWRGISMTLLTIAVIRMMWLFEIERRYNLVSLELQHRQTQEDALQARLKIQREAVTWLDGVVSISRLISSMESEDTVLCKVVTTARQAVDSDAAVLALRDDENRLILRYQSVGEEVTRLTGMPIHSRELLRVMQTGKPTRFSPDAPPTLTWDDGQRVWDVRQAAVVPLMLNNVVIGLLWTGRTNNVPFSENDLVGLDYLANQVVIALEQLTMAARLQSLAVIEERARIAREMHDGLAQILSYLGITMQTLETLVRQGNTQAALDELAQARREIKSAHADVRQNILSLRTTLSQDVNLKQALQTYVQEFGLQTGIQACFKDHTRDDLTLSPLAETQLTRIIQEALTNVRKHASATQVNVCMETDTGWLHLNIEDNGCGIQPDAATGSRFGLQTMRERAEDVDGHLQIDSVVDKGTTIRLSLPLV